MNRLKEELRRLNLLLEGDPANGTVTRIVVLGFTRAADWAAAARLHRSVQEAFEFPPPLVSIVAGGGYRLWFPLAEPVAVDAFPDGECEVVQSGVEIVSEFIPGEEEDEDAQEKSSDDDDEVEGHRYENPDGIQTLFILFFLSWEELVLIL